jgi:crotonobetainyl-CoA:carnitine CoA-transferase CaiB-like acyl-CoA transferase
MFETMAQFILGDHMAGHTFEPPIGSAGYARMLNEDRRPYVTKDGYLCVMFYSDKQWQAFFRLIGKPEIMETHPHFRTIASRTEHIHELYRMVAEIIATRTSAEWTAALESADIPVMPLNTLDSLMKDRHLEAVNFFEIVDHPTEGRVRTMAIPTTWSRSSPQVTRHAPRLGEHSREILAAAGYSPADIDTLAAQGVTMMADGPSSTDV